MLKERRARALQFTAELSLFISCPISLPTLKAAEGVNDSRAAVPAVYYEASVAGVRSREELLRHAGEIFSENSHRSVSAADWRVLTDYAALLKGKKISRQEAVSAEEVIERAQRFHNSMNPQRPLALQLKRQINVISRAVILSLPADREWGNAVFERQRPIVLASAVTKKEAILSAKAALEKTFPRHKAFSPVKLRSALEFIDSESNFSFNGSASPNAALHLLLLSRDRLESNFEKHLIELSFLKGGEALKAGCDLIALKREIAAQIVFMKGKLSPDDGPVHILDNWCGERITTPLLRAIPGIVSKACTAPEDDKADFSRLLRGELHALDAAGFAEFVSTLRRELSKDDLTTDNRIQLYKISGLCPITTDTKALLLEFFSDRMKYEKDTLAVQEGIAPALFNLMMGGTRLDPSEVRSEIWLKRASTWRKNSAENIGKIFKNPPDNSAFMEAGSLELWIKGLVDASNSGRLPEQENRNFQNLVLGLYASALSETEDLSATAPRKIFYPSAEPWFRMPVYLDRGMTVELVEERRALEALQSVLAAYPLAKSNN